MSYVLVKIGLSSYVSRHMAQETLLKPRQVAQMLAVSKSTVYRWFWEGGLKGVKLAGGTVRILAESVHEKLAEIA